MRLTVVKRGAPRLVVGDTLRDCIARPEVKDGNGARYIKAGFGKIVAVAAGALNMERGEGEGVGRIRN